MIDEKAILSLADKLEAAVDLLVNCYLPPEGWVSEMKWVIYDVRQDIEKGRLDFQGLVTNAEVEELRCRIDDLEKDNDRLKTSYTGVRVRMTWTSWSLRTRISKSKSTS